MLIKSVNCDPDTLAYYLSTVGAMAKAMPPAWDGASVCQYFGGPQGQMIGRVLPGRGLYVDFDLDRFGINKNVPHVYERSVTQSLIDILHSERGAISTYAALLTARGTKKQMFDVIGYKRHNLFPQLWASLFLQDGSGNWLAGTYGNVSATPNAGGTVMAATTAGGFLYGLHAPAGGDKAMLSSLGVGHRCDSASVLGIFVLADLLVAAGNIDTNSNSLQDVNTVALTRYTTGAGVLPTLEVFTNNLGNTNSNVTLTYTNQGGTGSQTTPALPMLQQAQKYQLAMTGIGPFIYLAAGDYGVKSVEKIQFSAAMGTAGRPVGLHLFYPLAVFPAMDGFQYMEKDFPSHVEGVVPLVTDGTDMGCLTAYYMNVTGSGTGEMTISFQLVHG